MQISVHSPLGLRDRRTELDQSIRDRHDEIVGLDVHHHHDFVKLVDVQLKALARCVLDLSLDDAQGNGGRFIERNADCARTGVRCTTLTDELNLESHPRGFHRTGRFVDISCAYNATSMGLRVAKLVQRIEVSLEPPRDLRRLQLLRRWSHEQV